MRSPIDSPSHDDQEYPLPSVEAILAGTLALMTGHAQSACAGQRRLMSTKIVSNMALLAEHPHLSANFRCALEQLRGHWQRLEQPGCDASGKKPMWHAAPGTVQ